MNDTPVICTIATRSYLAQARCLTESFLEHHSEGKVFVLLLDKAEEYIEPSLEWFTPIWVEDLEIPDWNIRLSQYSVFELSVSLKPVILEYVFEKYEYDKICWFDSDIYIYSSLNDEVWDKLNYHPIIITPHLLNSPNDYIGDQELNVARHGIYNSGFIGLSRHPDSQQFIQWWKNRLANFCYWKPEEGMFVDQRWLDFLPTLGLNVYISRSPGLNAGYWDLSNRFFEYKDGRYWVNRVPLKFFHFSKYSPDRPDFVFEGQKITFDERPDIKPIFDSYRNRLKYFMTKQQSIKQVYQDKKKPEPLQSQLQQIQMESEQLQSKLHASEEALEQSQSQLHASQMESEQLQSQLHASEEALEQSQSQLHASQMESEQLQSQLHTLEGALEQSQSQLHASQMESEQLQSQLHTLEGALEQSQSQLHASQMESEQLQSQLHTLEGALEQSQSQLHASQMESEQLQSQLHASEEALEQSQSQLHASQMESEQSQTQLHQTQGELEQSQTQLHQTQGELEQSQTQLHQTQGELEQSQSQLHQTQRELEQSQTQLHQTQGELEQSPDFIFLVSTLAAQLHTSEEELEESHAFVQLMQGKIEQLQRVKEQLSQTQEELKRTQTLMQEVEAEKDWLQSKYLAVRQMAQELQKELEQALLARQG